MKPERCPECGSRELGEGVFSGYASMTVLNAKGRPSLRSSDVVATVCSNCGLVVSLRVKKPEKFVPHRPDNIL